VSGAPTNRTGLGWVAPALLPAINLALALLLSGVVVLLVGESPTRALRLLVTGAFGNAEAIGYTLYYATSFVFTGLAVAVAFHGGLFNIGAEGQAYLGGLGVALLCLGAGGWPTMLVVLAAVVVASVFGAAWAFVPAWLQARRGSHVVITTIMFNFIAAALMTHLLVNVLRKPGQQSPETREFAASTWMPQLHDVTRALGWEVSRSPLNLSFVVALAAGAIVWFYLWHTRWGYELRALGHSETAAVYGGIQPARTVIVAMSISGALAGLMSLNEVMGVQHRLLLNFTGGAGYVGIAVALMGRNHPAGIVLAAVLFGALYQGGTELSFDMPTLTRDMVVVIQGLIILVCGALEQALRGPVEALLRRDGSGGGAARNRWGGLGEERRSLPPSTT
jgi:simple sugar transport system permease protein